MMQCTEIQSNLRLYSDGRLSPDENAQVKGHLQTCPVCRIQHSDILQIRNDLRNLRRPEIPVSVGRTLKFAVNAERRRGSGIWHSLAPDLRQWIATGLMPYAVG